MSSRNILLPADSHSAIIKEGWGTKQGGRIKTWKKRYFVLRETTLLYYTKPQGVEKGRIPIQESAIVTPAPECKKQPAFKISVPNLRTYYVVVEHEADVHDWVTALTVLRTTTSVHPATLADFDILKLIGRGTHSVVELVQHKKDNKLYAMKSIDKSLLIELRQLGQIATESDVLNQTHHPFLVGSHFTFTNDNTISFILDYVPGGTLFNRLKAETRFSESRCCLYGAEIIIGVTHLHEHGFIYRDLKPENILVDGDGHLKLTDFGLVKPNMRGRSTTTTFCGIPEFIAPEMLEQKPYTKSVDWWSFGILMYEMMVGIVPFYDENTNRLYHAIMHNSVKFPKNVSDTAQDLIVRLLEKQPEKRLGNTDCHEIMEHPFFGGLNWDDVKEKRIVPEWIPKMSDELDTSHWDQEFTSKTVTGPEGLKMVGINQR
jgi:serine/threonine protein kinase